jgi:hypothetical protein
MLTWLNGYSWPVPGRVCADGASTGLVQDTFTDTYEAVLASLRQSSHGDPYSERGQSPTGLVGGRCVRHRGFPFPLTPACPDSPIKTATWLALLRRQSHTSLTRETATGRGIDRHLLGLRLLMRPETACGRSIPWDGVRCLPLHWRHRTGS